MVQVSKHRRSPRVGDVFSVSSWVESIAEGRSQDELAIIHRAASLASDRISDRLESERVFSIASILHEIEADHDTIAAALLNPIYGEDKHLHQALVQTFSPSVVALVAGARKMEVLPQYHPNLHRRKKGWGGVESLRKMLLAMADDVRVVLITLADRLYTLGTLKELPGEQREGFAQETLDIFAPLANRLGIWQLKWELEDISFRYLEPHVYKQLATKLADRRIDRERHIKDFIGILQEDLRQSGIDADIHGRPKHIYSIWRKMQRKGLEFEQVVDVRGVRILVDDVQQCYGALGIVHTLWPHVSGEFDDYIATPKENNYQSVHTAVIGPQGNIVEVQIRTHDMHQHSELGIAAHWRYKDKVGADDALDGKIAWLRQLLQWKDEMVDASEFLDHFKSEVFEDRVYVFTPKGNVIDLPKGSTPLDFAYEIHTDVGHRCRGAKVNGRMIPLTYQLKTGEQVQILTVKKGGPSRDWLNPHLGYLFTTRARSKVQLWFRHQNQEQNVASGRAALEREFHNLGIGDVNLEKLAHDLNFNKADEFLAAMGRGEIKTSRIVSVLRDRIKSNGDELDAIPIRRHRRQQRLPRGFKIEGVGNLLTNMGQCCNPLPGDPIAGYITIGRGVTIHRRDCTNFLRHTRLTQERLVEVDWGLDKDIVYPVDIQITAYDRRGLLNDITSILSDSKTNVVAVNMETNKTDHVSSLLLTVEVRDIQTLSRVLSQITQIPNVTEARRLTH